MQSITIVGRLTRDPERRATRTGENMTTLNIAVNQKDGTTTYYHTSTYAALGEACYKYLKKGRQVVVTGELTIRNTNGKTYYNLDCKNMEFCGDKRSDKPETEMTETPLNGFEDITSEDVPF